MKGRNRCAFHGGKIRRGINSPYFNHSRFTQVLPGHNAVDVKRALEATDVVSMRDHFVTMDSFAKDVMRSMPDGDVSRIRGDLAALMQEIGIAIATDRKDDALNSLAMAEDLLAMQTDAEHARKEVMTIFREQGKIMQAEAAIRRTLDGQIDERMFAGVMNAMMSVVIRGVDLILEKRMTMNERAEAHEIVLDGVDRIVEHMELGHGIDDVGPLALAAGDVPHGAR